MSISTEMSIVVEKNRHSSMTGGVVGTSVRSSLAGQEMVRQAVVGPLSVDSAPVRSPSSTHLRSSHGLERPVPTTKQKIYIVDSDTRARRAMADTIRAHSTRYVCKTFTTAEDLLAALDHTSRGCVVTDLFLPGMSGLDLLAELSRGQTHLPVVAITSLADTQATVAAVQSGVVTVLDKPCNASELVDSIRHGLKIESKRRRRATQLAKAKAGFVSLTEKEQQILWLIADGHSNKQIARQVDMGLRTVEGRRQAVFSKMDVKSLAELVRLAVLLEHATY